MYDKNYKKAMRMLREEIIEARKNMSDEEIAKIEYNERHNANQRNMGRINHLIHNYAVGNYNFSEDELMVNKLDSNWFFNLYNEYFKNSIPEKTRIAIRHAMY